MIEKVYAYVKKYHMIEAGDTIIAGVSGGADSVCLLFALLKIREKIPFHLAVVHVNHLIRQEAGEDAAFVKDLCEKWQLPFYLIEKNVRAYAKSIGLSEEEAGRKIRYEAFEEVLQKEIKKNGEDLKTEEVVTSRGKIAVAHNSNDRAETMLFHLFRGTGLSGAGGIKPVSGNIIRPILCLAREEIETWLIKEQISWCIDATNAKDDYTRNRIRHHILPYAEEQVCNGIVMHMNRAADDFQAAEAFIYKEVLKAKERCVHRLIVQNEPVEMQSDEADRIELDIPLLQKEDEYLQGRILLSVLEELVPGRKDITAEHIANIKKLLLSDGSKELYLPYQLVVHKKYDKLAIMLKKANRQLQEYKVSEQFPEYDVSISGRMEILGLGEVEISVFSYEKTEIIPRKTYTKWFDYDKITTSVRFRVRRAGDYLTINNKMDKKSLQDYFVNEKIPKEERDSCYILADGAHIMWVPGYRISEYYKVSEETKTILEVKIVQSAEEERSHENG